MYIPIGLIAIVAVVYFAMKEDPYQMYKSRRTVYLLFEMVFLAAAQLAAWYLPWTKIDENNNLITVFKKWILDKRIHKLNYMGTTGQNLNNIAQKLKIKNLEVNEMLYDIGAIIITLCILITLVYIVMCFAKSERRQPKGTIATVTLIVGAILIELYRINVNQGLEVYYGDFEKLLGTSEILHFSSTGNSLLVIGLAIAGWICGRKNIEAREMLYKQESWGACPSCRSKYKPGAHFCSNCGKQAVSDYTNGRYNTAVIYKCAECGYSKPYTGQCPSCGSSHKVRM